MNARQFTEKGTFHQSRNEENQDSILISEAGNCVTAAVCDGTTVCKNSAAGAHITAEAVCSFFHDSQQFIQNTPDTKLKYLLMEHIHFCLEMAAGKKEQLSEYASTVGCITFDSLSGNGVVMNLGDGAVYLISGGRPEILLAPHRINGNPYLTTMKNVYREVKLQRIHLDYGDTVFLCTDGFLNALQNESIAEAFSRQEFDKLDGLLARFENIDDLSYAAVTRTL